MYNKDSIQALSDIDHIRHRIGMYIGSKGQEGINHLFNEVFDNSVDEALQSHCNLITVEYSSTKVCITDNGRGIPSGYREDLGMDVLTALFTQTKTSGKYSEDSGYKGFSAGTNGVGLKCVNALSSHLLVVSKSDGKFARQTFKIGIPEGEVQHTKVKSDKDDTGTTVEFSPDFSLFEVDSFDYDHVIKRCKCVSSMIPELKIKLINLDTGVNSEFKEQSGEHLLSIYEEEKFSDELPLFSHKFFSPEIQVRLGYFKTTKFSSCSYMNTIETFEDGSHIDGVLKALVNSISKISKKKYTTSQITQGLTLVASCFHTHPTYRGQNKSRVSDSSVSSKVYEIIYEDLYIQLSKSPDFIKYLCSLIDSQEKALEDLEVNNLAKSVKNNIKENILPLKLVPAYNASRKDREIFIVEGNSAAGSVSSARSPQFQEVLPLKGKILNAYKSDTIFSSKEVQDIFSAIGGTEKDHSNLRCENVYLVVDSDVDGAHIACLILSLFQKVFPTFISKFGLYIVHTPLFSLDHDKGVIHGFSLADCKAKAKSLGIRKYEIHRNKGIGQISPADMVEFIKPDTRKIVKIFNDESSSKDMELLMGVSSEERRVILEEI